MRHEWFRALGFFLVFAIMGAVLLVLGPRLLSTISAPEAEVLTQLKRTERDGLTLSVPGTQTPLVSSRHRFDRVVVELLAQEKAPSASATATLDFDGKFGKTHVGSLGLERSVFELVDRSWVAKQGLAPLLSAVVGTLEARRSALERADREALSKLAGEGTKTDAPELEALLQLGQRAYQVKAWYIRTDRDQVLVTEEYRLTGTLPDRPVDEQGNRRLVLENRDGMFFFAAGLL